MDYVRNIENLVAIHIATIETQIQSIQFFSRQRFPAALAHQTKVLAETLLRTLETIEQQYIEDVEKESEGILGKFAEFTKILETAEKSESSEGAELFKRLAQITRKGHHSLTSTLSEEEIRLTSDISERFKKMKSKVTSLISRIEAL